jgi:hypothetical protein
VVGVWDLRGNISHVCASPHWRVKVAKYGKSGQMTLRFFHSPWPWLGIGLLFWGLNALAGDAPRPPLKFADVLLYALMIAGLLMKGGQGFGIMLPRRFAPLAYMTLSWVFGMIFEASLTVDGTGIGGMHPQTRASFILAQGDYVMTAIVTWVLVRTFHLSFRDVFFVSGGMSLAEGLIFTGVLTAVLLSPTFFIAPLFLAYYAVAYASYVALPLLIIAPESLWSKDAPRWRPGWFMLWPIGFALAFVTHVIWGLGWIPFANKVFDLPPNLAGM